MKLTNAQTNKRTKPPTMVTKSNRSKFCFCPRKRKKLNFIQNMNNNAFLSIENHVFPFLPYYSSARKPNEMHNGAPHFRDTF